MSVRAEFRDCFRTVRAKFSGLFADSLDIIFQDYFRVVLDCVEVWF